MDSSHDTVSRPAEPTWAATLVGVLALGLVAALLLWATLSAV